MIGKPKDGALLYLGRKDVLRASEMIDSVEVIKQVFHMHGLGQTVLPDEAYLGWVNGRDEWVRSLNMPGYLGGDLRVGGTKIINGNICNPQRGLPRASGLTILYNDISVRAFCILEGAYISSLRTASVTALSTELLQHEAPVSMALIGSGVLAQAHLELLTKRFTTLRDVYIYDVVAQRAEEVKYTFAALLAERNVTLHIAASAEQAIRAAQLIVPVTTTTTGYIRYEWLQPGALLVNISLDDPLPEVVHRADLVVVDDWHLVRSDERRLLGRMYRAGEIIGPEESQMSEMQGRRKVDAQLGELVLGEKGGRQSPGDIILVNPFGLALEDVALAYAVYQVACNLGLGVELEF